MRTLVLGAVFTMVLAGTVGQASARPTSHAPRPASHLKIASRTSTSVSLTWREPKGSSVKSVVVRYAKGSRAPVNHRAGTLLATIRKPGHSYVKHGLHPGTRYAFSLFTKDRHGHYSRAAKIVTTTRSAPSTPSTFNGHWTGHAKAPDSTVTEPVTFTVSGGRVTRFQGWIDGFCSNGSLDDVYLAGPAAIKSNGSVARAESITPVPGYTATSSMIGFFHGRTANGTIDYVFTGCAESPWTWTAARA